MRPRRLEMRGFTAFRDPIEIDFTDLDLFALWGPMGSGKSSVLDALTYALYGKVERVGVSTSQLVSQGQPRMSVLLEFDVADHQYRITRSTPAKGTTKVLLERHDGSDWRSFGEGADRARDVNKTLTDLIGLDYPAFTRAVLLPQGRFAEFLNGDAADRRKILTELLGLELFGRMAGIARSIADTAKADAGARLSLLDQYADVDEKAVAAAEAEAEEAQKIATKAVAVETELEALGKQGESLDREIGSLEECGTEATELGERLADDATRLMKLAEETDEAAPRMAAARSALAKADKAHTKATTALEKSTNRWGSLEDLIQTRSSVQHLDRARAELATTESSELDAIKAVEEAQKRQRAVAKDLEKAVAAAEKAAHVATEQEARVKEAERSDLVGTLTHELHKGDPCPVCDRPLERIPKSDSKALAAAKKQLIAAQDAAAAARKDQGQAETQVALATRSVETALEQQARCKTERTKRAKVVTEFEKSLKKMFGTKVPTDPLAEIEQRIESVRALVVDLNDAAGHLKIASEAVAAMERDQAALATQIAAARGALEAAPLNTCVRRALKVAPDIAEIAFPDPLPETPRDLAAAATTTATALAELARELADKQATKTKERTALAEHALKIMAPVLSEDVEIPAANLTELLTSFRNLVRDLEKAAATSAESARSIKSDLEKRVALEKEVAEKRSVDATYRALARELSGNHIVDHLQSEALGALAAAGSARLTYLSSGRYRLAYEGDEFFVIDGWNGEERRSVRTLSGGETFLASLALALALSDEVKNLAVTDKAPIESLFLDEGFGSLDAETLDTVVSAIEQLGGDGRMVGVITHVADVADRLPVKLVVTKSPRGSHIEREISSTLEFVG